LLAAFCTSVDVSLPARVPPHCRGVNPLNPWFAGCLCRQNIHNKEVASKIFHQNELAPEGISIPARLTLFSIYIFSIAIGA
jgi:hypothetical protein